MNINYFVIPGLVTVKELKILTVKNIVLDYMGVSWEDILKENRKAPLPDARKVLAYCINKYCGKTTTVALGKLLRRDHATILYYFKQVDNLKLMDYEFRDMLQQIEYKINLHNETI
jgi:chromosomal replication initiation ATPase DnaA